MNQQINNQREFDFNDSDFRFLSDLAYKNTGIVLAEHKRDMVYSRLARRLRALGFTKFSEYCELLKSDNSNDEMMNLVNAITTNLTSFFRENHHFEHLRDQVLKPMLNSNQKKLRIWSSACSAGMEPYSIAMVVKDTIKDISSWDAKILATDIDSNMLNTGKIGEYQAQERKGIPDIYSKYASEVNDGKFSIRDDLKEIIAFKQLNLLEAWPMKGPFDAIFCRNVVIYFDKPTKQKLFSRLADMLKPDGWLYIGHSENMHGICDRFELLGRTIYRRIK